MIAITSQQILELGLQNMRAAIISRSIDAGQKASGRTYGHLEIRNVTDTHGEFWGPTWVAVWEDGRKPGRVPYDFAAIIMEWATNKGISFASSDPVTFERWARGVAWHIHRYGTELYRSGQKLDIFETPIAEFERWLTGKLKEFYAGYLTNDIRTACLKG